MTRRVIEIEGVGKTIEISKVTAVKADKIKNAMLYLDELKDGTYRLIYSEDLIPDFKDVTAFKVIRE